MTARHDVLVVGEVLVELSSPVPLRETTDLRLGFSGDAFNAAAAAAAAGASVALLTNVGDDELGSMLVDAVAARGIDTSLIARTRAPNGVYFVAADPHGEREFVYARAGSAASRLAPADAEAAAGACGALVVSGITQALSDSCAALVARAAALASAAGAQVVFDPNFRPRLTSAAAARRGLAAVAPHAALVTPSCPGDAEALLDTTDPVVAAERCRALGASAAAVTQGPADVLVDAGQGVVAVPAPPAPRVVDGTGAGDVFAGTIAARLALGDELLDAVALGCAASSLSLAGQGGAGHLATLDDVRAHLGAAADEIV